MIVHRGIGIARALRGLAKIALVYLALLAILWALGLFVYGWRGWLVVLAPLAAWIGARAWAWQRVSVEIADGTLRYEGSSRRDDFEIPLERIEKVRAGDGLVLTIDGRERALEISPRSARALAERLSREPR